MTVLLWIIIAFFTALCVLVGLAMAGVIGDGHPSDRKWQKICQNPVFPADEPMDAGMAKVSDWDSAWDSVMKRIAEKEHRINDILYAAHARIRICNWYDSLEESDIDLIDRHGLEVSVYLEEFDSDVKKTDVTQNRYVLKVIKPKNEVLMPTKNRVNIQFEILCDWLSLFLSDPSPLGLESLCHSLSSRHEVRGTVRGWYEKYAETYSDHLVTLTDF